MAVADNKKLALERAAELSLEALSDVDIATRAQALGLPAPKSNGDLAFVLLGRHVVFSLPSFEGTYVNTGKPVHPVERLLVLHALGNQHSATPTGELITFRQMPGGQFYWQPFRNRSVEPLVSAFGDDIERLRAALNQLDWDPLERGDLGARIHVFGKIEVSLVYHCGDDEFGPEADILFDASLKHLFVAEDVVAMCGRVCMRISKRICKPCSGCGYCDHTPAKPSTKEN